MSLSATGINLIRVAGAVDEPSLFDGLIPEGEREHSEPILLPAEAAQSFNAALKKRKKKKGEPTPHITVSHDGSAVRLASAGKVIRRFDVTPPDLPFPNIAQVMRPHVEVKRVVLGVDLMLTVLKALKGCGCSSVTLSLSEGETAPVKLSAFSMPMGPVEGVVMPMRDDRAKEEAA